MNSERQILKRLLEGCEEEYNPEATEECVNEAEHTSGGSEYKSSFGNYTKDGEPISREEYFDAKGDEDSEETDEPEADIDWLHQEVTVSDAASILFPDDDRRSRFIGSDGDVIAYDKETGKCKVKFSTGETLVIPSKYLELN